ncbi:substrate-binding domain-containing protein [soil metagenome]
MTPISIPRWFIAGAMAVATALSAPSAASAADIGVASSGGFAEAYKAVKPAYERKSGNTLTIAFGPSMGDTPNTIPSRLKRGEPIDVVLMVDSAVDGLIKDGLVDPASKTVLAKSIIGMAVKSGAPKPDISSLEALKRTLLEAKSIAYSDSASGVYLQNVLFPKLGIWEQIRSKCYMSPADPVGGVVARGAAEIGFQQMSELKPIAGIDIVAPLPEGAQLVTPYTAAIVSKSAQPREARAFIDYLLSPEAAALIRETGLEPGK